MLNETFYLDGVSAESFGLKLQAPIEFTKAVPIYETQTVAGRNGTLIRDTGSYENRTGTASCFCLQENVAEAIGNVGRFLTAQKGYRRLETSDDPEHFWLARVKNSPKIEMRCGVLAPFDVAFDCKPQRFLKVGEMPIVTDEAMAIVNSYGQTALPLIKIVGSDRGRVHIGDCVIDIIDFEGDLWLDSETQNAYSGEGNQNHNIIAAEFPTLPSGETGVWWEGDIDEIQIIPRWWEV